MPFETLLATLATFDVVTSSDSLPLVHEEGLAAHPPTTIIRTDQRVARSIFNGILLAVATGMIDWQLASPCLSGIHGSWADDSDFIDPQ